MAEQNPTVIIAHLNDEQLRKSIDSLVGYVDKQFQSMVSTTSTRVGEMQTKLNELSQIKVDSNGSADGGSSKRAKSIQSEKQSLESLQMSYDKLLGALQMAQRQERVLAGKDIWTLTREELDKYAATLQHVSELEKSLSAMRGQMSLAMAEKGQFSPNMKEYTDGLVRTSDEMKKMSSYYKELEKSSDRVTQQVRQESGSYDLLAQQIQRAVQQADRRYSTNDEILNLRANLHNVEAQLRDVQTAWSKFNPTLFPWVKDTETYNNKLKELQEQLERVRMLRGNAVGPNKEDLRNSLGNELSRLKGEIEALTQERQKFLANESKESQLKEQYAEISKQIQSIGQSMIDVDNAEKGLTQTTQRYTEEVLKQAQAIRENKQFQEQGFVLIGDKNFYDPEKSLMPKKAIKSLEEQILTSQMEQTRQSQIQKENEEALAAETKGEATVRDKAAEARARMMRAEEEMLALTTSETAKQEEMNLLLQRAKTLYDEIKQNRTHDEKLGVSNSFQVQSTTESIQRLRAAYDALSESDKKSPFGKELRSYIKELERDLSVLTLKMEDEALMNNQLGNSYEVLARKLRRLQTIYNQLSESERNSQKGKDIADNIQKTSRYLNEIRTQESRPISLGKALGNPENTLDRIAHKIQQLNAYRGGLNLTDPKQVGEMRTVENEIDRLKKKQDELMGKNHQLMNSNNALARSWNYMKNRLAFYFTVGASTQFVKNLIEVRSQYEMNERALGILIDSAERGTQIFNELSQMALVSPYTLIELSSAAKQLTAYDVAAKDVVDTTRRLADMASAVGIPIERLTYALGQIKAYGYLNSRDARMFLNAGIPLVKNLADHYTELEGRMVSVGDVYDRMKKKAIGYNDVMQVITEMTDEGGKFFDFQAKMADTLKVQLANLTLAWNNMLNEIGKSEQGVLVGGIKGLKELFLQWEKINTLVRNLAITFGFAKLLQVIQIATLGMDAFGKKMVWQILVGKKLQVVLYNIAGSLKAIVSSPLTWWALLATAVVSAGMALYDANKALKEFNKSIADGGKENYENTKKFLQQYQDLRNELQIKNGTLKDGRTTPAAGVSKDEAEKAWVAIREQIELTSQSSDYFIGKLLSIDDVNKRVEKGFDYLQKIQDVYGSMSSMDDDTIAIKETYRDWWNLGLAQDGVIGNLKEYIETKKLAEEEEKKGAAWHETETVFAKRIEGLWSSADIALQQYRSDLDVTLESMANFAQTQGFDFDQEKEFFSQTINKIVTQRNLGEREALQFRLDAEERYKDARIKQFDEVIEFETKRAGEAAAGAEKDRLLLRVKAAQQEKAAWLANQEEMYGEGLVLFEGFTKYMTRNHGSELQKLFGNMTKKEIEQINWSEPRWKKWAEDNAKAFAEQFGVSFDKLKKYVNDANRMTIFIRTIVQKPDDKSVYDTLTEADKAADEAWNKIQRLKTHKGELESKGAIVAGTRDIDTDYANTIQEITDAQKDYNDALAKGGHSKKENTTNTKAQKQAETELQKALKDELSLLDKVHSQYKKLTDAGVDGTTALNMVTNQFTNSIQRINNILGRNGLPLFNIKAFAGTDNPNAVLEMLKKQLDAAKVAKSIKPEEIKELEVKYGEIVIDAKVYNTKKITDGLNNELSKIKDEYELALELDADPEMGSAFAQLFDIDTNQLPKNLEDYAKRATEILNRYFKDDKIELPTINLTDDDLKAYKAILGESKYKILESFTKDYKSRSKKEAQDIVKQTKDLQYKLGDVNEKIAIESKKLADLQVKYQKETNDEKKRLLDLQIKDQENAIKELQSQALVLMPEYKKVFGNIAEYSANVARKLQNDLRSVYDNAKYDPKTGQYELVGSDGKPVFLDKEQYTKEYNKLNKELQKTKSNFQKIKEAFKPSDKDGVVDYAKGIELVAEEAKKAADGLHTVADIISYIGGSDDAVETLNDIATSMEGVGTAAQGIVQIKNKDYIGGAVNVLKGTWQAVSTWFDNSDKRISNEIANSERQVRRLELAYIDLEHAINDAYGTETIGAQKAAIANKELQLAELKRQLTLEQSRKKKNQDKDRIIELQKQIKELEYDIKSMTDEIVNDLLGISSVGDAMESLMDSFIEALRSGEDAMAIFDDSIDNMIANMVKKMFTTKILQPWFEKQWDLIQKDIDERVGKEMPKKIAELTGQVDTAKRANLNNRDSVWEALASMGLSAEQIHQYESYDAAGNYIFDASKRFERRKELYEKMLDDKEKALDAAQREYTELTDS